MDIVKKPNAGRQRRPPWWAIGLLGVAVLGWVGMGAGRKGDSAKAGSAPNSYTHLIIVGRECRFYISAFALFFSFVDEQKVDAAKIRMSMSDPMPDTE